MENEQLTKMVKIEPDREDDLVHQHHHHHQGLNSKPLAQIEPDPDEDLDDAASLNNRPLGLSATINRIKVVSFGSS